MLTIFSAMFWMVSRELGSQEEGVWTIADFAKKKKKKFWCL